MTRRSGCTLIHEEIQRREREREREKEREFQTVAPGCRPSSSVISLYSEI